MAPVHESEYLHNRLLAARDTVIPRRAEFGSRGWTLHPIGQVLCTRGVAAASTARRPNSASLGFFVAGNATRGRSLGPVSWVKITTTSVPAVPTQRPRYSVQRDRTRDTAELPASEEAEESRRACARSVPSKTDSSVVSRSDHSRSGGALALGYT